MPGVKKDHFTLSNLGQLTWVSG
jgi:hypothetical protein